MGFFDDVPAPEPEPPPRHHPWEPPEAEFPGIVPVDTLLLGRTDEVAVYRAGIDAQLVLDAAQRTIRLWPENED